MMLMSAANARGFVCMNDRFWPIADVLNFSAKE